MQTDVRVERVNIWTFDNDVFRGHYMEERVSTATICRTSKNFFQGCDNVRVFLKAKYR